MKKIYLITVITSVCLFTSCVDLDITPKNILTAQDIYSEAGIKAYMAGMYRYLPLEDFHYDATGGNNGYFNDLCLRQIGSFTGEMTNDYCGTGVYHQSGYWTGGFKLVRQANTLICDLPGYPELADYAQAWIAEAKFIRAHVYFQLAKRYGGLPVIEAPQIMNSDDESALWIARSSHADTYDFILKDLDDAIAGLPETSEAGRVNKYVAAGLKSRVALYAATTARYGHDKFADWEVDGVLLQGIPANRAADYFKQAWDATKLIEGKYELHNANADKTANFAEVWEKCDNNSESMWLRKYDFPNIGHSADALFSPVRMSTTYAGFFSATLDWVELFDGLPLNGEGHFNAFDADGHYLVYDNCQQLWEAAEPRLRAHLLLPGMIVRGGLKVDHRAGIFKHAVDPEVDKFKKFSIDDGATDFDYRNSQNDSRIPEKNLFVTDANPDGKILTQNSNNTAGEIYDGIPGTRIYIAGLDGPKMKWNGQRSTLTGIAFRKFIDLNKTTAQTTLYVSTQSWIEMRYAEILLNRAEAALELLHGGESSYQGVDLQQDAFECINAIRNRAGAKLLAGKDELSTAPAYTNWTKPGPKGQGGYVEAPNRALQILRVERYKELANEAKIYWDLMRWFTFDTQVNLTNKRGLYSFMFSRGATVDENGIPDGKYIYDAKQAEHNGTPATFDKNRYYEGIPINELQNNPLLQKNRNQ